MQFVLRLLSGCHFCLAVMENSQWRAYDVLGTRLCASFHLTIIPLTFVSVSFSLSDIHTVPPVYQALCKWSTDFASVNPRRHCVIWNENYPRFTDEEARGHRDDLNDLPKVAQTGSGGAGTQALALWPQMPCYPPRRLVYNVGIVLWFSKMGVLRLGAVTWLVCKFIHVFRLHTLCVFYLPQLPPCCSKIWWMETVRKL